MAPRSVVSSRRHSSPVALGGDALDRRRLLTERVIESRMVSLNTFYNLRRSFCRGFPPSAFPCARAFLLIACSMSILPAVHRTNEEGRKTLLEESVRSWTRLAMLTMSWQPIIN
jgi:hypothetical protein